MDGRAVIPRTCRNGLVDGDGRCLKVPGRLIDDELQIDARGGSLDSHGAQYGQPAHADEKTVADDGRRSKSHAPLIEDSKIPGLP